MRRFAVDPSWTDKDSRVERFRALYETNDFLAAYAAHTDLRMQDDPKGAIGRSDEWESHGILQLEFLISCGMKPEHRLLDIGCGPGRGARRFVPYLAVGNYCGVDISTRCLEYAADLASSEGWSSKNPRFVRSGDVDLLGVQPFEFVWAHSVFTHLPDEQIDKMVGNIVALLADGGRFYFTYKQGHSPQRTGLKQWRYPFSFFEGVAKSHRAVAKSLHVVWPASQRTGLIAKA